MKLNGTTLNSLQRAIVAFASSGYHSPYGMDSASGFNDSIQNNLDKISASLRTTPGLVVSTHRSLKLLSITATESSGKVYELHVGHSRQLPDTRHMNTTFSIMDKGRATWLTLDQPFKNAEASDLHLYLSIGSTTVPLHELDSPDAIPSTLNEYLSDLDFITKEDITTMLKVIKSYLLANSVTVNW